MFALILLFVKIIFAFSDNCYLFISSPKANRTYAKNVCNALGSTLASIKSIEEHFFITDYLENNDPALNTWFTSGLFTQKRWLWDDGTLIHNYGWLSTINSQEENIFNHELNLNLTIYKLSDLAYFNAQNYLIYEYSFKDGAWKWNLTEHYNQYFTRAFICKTSIKSSYKSSVLRNFDINLDLFKSYQNLIWLDENFINNDYYLLSNKINPKGVNFIREPIDITYDIKSLERSVSLECLADGYPSTEYTWFKNDIPIVTTSKDPLNLNFNLHGNKDDVTSYYSIGSYSFVQNINNFNEPGYERISITNGLLEIFDPDSETDQGVYHCSATNKYGTALSSKAVLSFAYIKDFKPDSLPIKASVRSNAIIPCQAPEAYPDYLPNFVTNEARIFHSWKGNLYFSNVEMSDEANYICMIKSGIDKTAANTFGKTSKPIPLQVTSTFINSKKKPTIEIGFPSIFPNTPLMGQDVRIECVAYGDPLPFYNWSRADSGPIPNKVRFEDYNRVLIIPKVMPSDVGNYLCKAFNIMGDTEYGVYLTLSAAPVFTTPLKDKFISKGSTVQFICTAYGNPQVKYRWFKNGKLLDQSLADNSSHYLNQNNFFDLLPNSGDPKPRIQFLAADEMLGKEDINDIFSYSLERQYNILVMRDVSERDNGIYQCEASNGHGTRFSTAQLKVLAFKPIFIPEIDKGKEYLTSYHDYNVKMVAQGSDLNLSCHPKSSPTAKFDWFYTPFSHTKPFTKKKSFHNYYEHYSQIDLSPKNKGNLLFQDNHNIQIYSPNSIESSSSQHTSILSIKEIDFSHSGIYTCDAKNNLGKGFKSNRIIVTKKTKIKKHPKSIMNQFPGKNLTLSCKALAEKGIEITFKWFHNSRVINLEEKYFEKRFIIKSNKEESILIILNSRISQNGEYFCVAISPISSEKSKLATVLIAGVPYAPSAITATHLTTTTANLIWSNGGHNGHSIIYYVIQGKTKFRDWFTIKKVTANQVKIAPNKRNEVSANYAKREYLIDGLLPYNSYEFRLAGKNSVGLGEFSPTSASYTMASDLPRVVPKNIRGGGGMIGDLVIQWDPLLGDEFGAPGLGYEIFWLRKDDWLRSNKQAKFFKHFIHEATKGFYVTRVGRENFYTDYVVKIRAVNSIGPGPESQILSIKSAQDVPTKEPTLVQAFPYNSTAVTVRWKGLPSIEDRHIIRGRLLGYKIQYGLIKENIDHNSYHDLAAQSSMTSQNEDLYQANDRQTRILYGAINEGIIIGLIPNSRYWIKVMAFNSAGNGPVSDPIFMNTFKEAPLMQPTDITITGPNSDGALRIAWNGIYTSNKEEPLEGYKIRIWEGREDISEFVDIPVGLITYRDIYSFPEHRLYKIRILGYSRGGDGKMSQSLEICLKCNEIEKQDHIEKLNQEYLEQLEYIALKKLNLKSSATIKNICIYTLVLCLFTILYT